MPFTVMGLVPQPTLEDVGDLSLMEGTDGHRRQQAEVGVSYTLWRNPDDHDDPGNLAELDEVTRASLEIDPPWPRPSWILDSVKRLRYRRLPEAVRTSWSSESYAETTLAARLVQHVNHILVNHFRTELGLAPGPTFDGPWRARQSSVNRRATLEVDGVARPAAEIDTDPFVYGVGVQLSEDVVVTVAIARSELPFVRLALAPRGMLQPG
ncbi:hypothetical protein [Microbacterium sp. SORGH_AS_0888]|uniref:hypothetical protein n=1 Tax=Microbacterium sp. SORGH_AS_0888 TaxID=3041791 RepID=UPI0027858688|nr:hypothetical protein [Microbacterium sp. SORGH_AS_0888]MDQ1131123.1 hypothetical protein [Microbacterium sp. SORGH_AS_0888]